jgi:hypothetical protein
MTDEWQQCDITDGRNARTLLTQLLLQCGVVCGPFGHINQRTTLVIATTKNRRAGLFINCVYHSVSTLDNALR